jgi:hypothetical protein
MISGERLLPLHAVQHGVLPDGTPDQLPRANAAAVFSFSPEPKIGTVPYGAIFPEDYRSRVAQRSAILGRDRGYVSIGRK